VRWCFGATASALADIGASKPGDKAGSGSGNGMWSWFAALFKKDSVGK